MAIFKLMHSFDRVNRNNMVCRAPDDFANLYCVDQYDVTQGKRLNNWDANFSFYFNPDEGRIPTDYLINDLAWFVVSPGLRAVLERIAADDIQFLPVKIVNLENGEVLDGFSVANVINTVDALDMEHSTYSNYEVDGERILAVRKHVLQGDRLLGCNVFRIKNDIIPVFLSEEVHDSIINEKLTGCSFLPIRTT